MTSVTRHLQDHDWPGNVRELSHYAERFVLGLERMCPPSHANAPLRARSACQIAWKNMKRRHGGDVQQTIAALGIHRKTFYDKLQRHGIVRSH
jgi:two-component system, NtrC family, C4-dicarboxylate transport response regulator DctD